MSEVIEVWDIGSKGYYMHRIFDWKGDMEEIKDLFHPYVIYAWRITEVEYTEDGEIVLTGKIRMGTIDKDDL